MFKRIFALVLALAMALSVAACGKGKTNGDGGDTTDKGVNLDEVTLDTDALLAQMPADLKGSKITFLNWYDPDTREEKSVIDAFEQKSGITVEYIIKTYMDYVNELSALVQTGQAPDVVRMKEPNIGVLKTLQPLSATGFDFSGAAWDKQTMKIYTVGQNQYGMALLNTPFYLPLMMFYNTVVMEDMGFEDPWTLWKEGKWTWDKFEEMCTEWVKQGPDYQGSILTWANTMLTTKNASFTKYDGSQYTMDLTDAEAISAYQKLSEFKAHNISAESQESFEDGTPKVLFGVMDATAIQTSSKYFQKVRLRKRLATVPVPMWEGKDYFVPMMENVAFGICKGAKNPKAAPYFVAYMCNFANYDTSDTNFFFTEQAKEVYMDLLGRANRAYNADETLFTYSGEVQWFVTAIAKIDISQTNTYLQERSNIYQNSINMYNAELEALTNQ